jgi:hypothetical protein
MAKEFYNVELPNGKVVQLRNATNKTGRRGVEVYRDGKKICFVDYHHADEVANDIEWYNKFVEEFNTIMKGHI